MIKNIINDIQENIEACVYKDIPDNFNSMPYSSIIPLVGRRNKKFILVKKSENMLFFGTKFETLQRCGHRFYIKSNWNNCIVINCNKLTISRHLDLDAVMYYLLNFFHITWCRDLNSIGLAYITKKSILKDIIEKKIYNLETYYKTIAHKCFRFKDVNWKTFRNYLHIIQRGYSFPFFDLKDFTVNVINSIDVISKAHTENNDFKLSLLSDLLRCAVKLDEKVNFAWSEKRIHEEHLRQIRELNFKEISSKKQDPIYSDIVDTPNIKMLNTEADIFMEGLNMHHCIYSCYYSKIKEHRYLAFHMNLPEDCTFGIKLEGHQLILDQIYLKYDKAVQPSTKTIAISFIKQNYDKLVKLISSPSTKEFNIFLTDEELLDIPF